MRWLHVNRGRADLAARALLFTLTLGFMWYALLGPETVLRRYVLVPAVPIYIWAVVVFGATRKDPPTWRELFWAAKGSPLRTSPRWQTIGSWVTLATSTLLVIVVLGSLQLGLLP
jgi:hypothetical protein